MKTLHNIRWTIISLLVTIVVSYSIGVCVNPKISGLVKINLQNPNFHYAPWIFVLYAHIITAIIAISIGPIQFLFKKKSSILHKRLGITYVLAVLISGFISLYLSLLSSGGWMAHIGFLMMDLFWITSTSFAYKKARNRQLLQHRNWMLRSYAITFAAVTLRLYLQPLITLTHDFTWSYTLVAWLAWIPNIIIIELWIRRESRLVQKAAHYITESSVDIGS